MAEIIRIAPLRQKWVKAISASWQGGVQSIIETGRNLIAAKDELPRGDWISMIEEELPFGRQTAFCLITIASDDRLTNVNHGLHFPPSWRTLYELHKLDDKTFEAAIRDGTINSEMERNAAARLRRPVKSDVVPEGFPDAAKRCKLILSSIEDAKVKDDSLDCILTDPPYPEEFIPLYGVLANKAARWLKPGGSLVVMAGQTHLPQVLSELCDSGLSYQWTTAYLTPGGQAVQIFPRKVNTFWKPVFWFVKGEYIGPWIGDVAKSDANDKRFHHWGQSESGFADLMDRFTKVGDHVCDPFMGGGTTGVIALKMNRYFLGIEKDMETFNTAKSRLFGAP